MTRAYNKCASGRSSWADVMLTRRRKSWPDPSRPLMMPYCRPVQSLALEVLLLWHSIKCVECQRCCFGYIFLFSESSKAESDGGFGFIGAEPNSPQHM